MTATKSRWKKTADGWLLGNVLVFDRGTSFKPYAVHHQPSRLGIGLPEFDRLRDAKQAVAFFLAIPGAADTLDALATDQPHDEATADRLRQAARLMREQNTVYWRGKNPHRHGIYNGCFIAAESDLQGIYFGVGLSGCDDEGYAKHFVRVVFPDETWIRCANRAEAERYIDGPNGVAAHGFDA